MKRSNLIIKIMTVLIAVLVITSCKKWIDPEINVDPNKPADVPLSLLLPGVEVGTGYAMGGDLRQPACQWMQQFAGLGNQPIAFDRYNFTQSDVDNVWKWALYAGVMRDLKVMIDKAVTDESPHYGGVAKIMMAYNLGTVSDLWGDVPYTDAFRGNDNLKPYYDTQEEIYGTINTLLNEAITDLSSSSSNFSPSNDDLIYGGDLDMWKKAAYTFKARYALHLSKKNGASAYTDALSYLPDAISSNDEDLEIYFGQPANEQNPFYQFLEQRPGDITMCATFVEMLINANDPRLDQVADTSGGAIGSHPGLGDGDAPPTGYYAQPDSPVPFITYVEALFIKAECEYKLGTGDPKQSLKDAVAESLTKFGVYDLTWVTDYNAMVDGLSGEALFEEIMSQKYIALFDQVETFTDWRRTNYPTLQPSAYPATIDQQIPRRYPYPTSERIYNGANMPSGLTISSRVWWDVP